MSRRMMAAVALAVPVTLVAAAGPAGACGGVFGENGTLQLVKTTTLAAYTDGVERYVTAFEFSGQGESVGSIVPLADVPTDVTAAGDWTLQRLVDEVAPPSSRQGFDEDAAVAESASAEVILETQVEALDITVLRGGADEVGQWALDNGFLLTPDAPEVLDFYAARSDVFMAAKFDAGRAAELGQGAGDSTAIMATIPTDDPWVPIRILGLGADGEQTIQADVFLLTDERPEILAGGDGMNLARSERASTGLLSDLRSDQNMSWVPRDMWLSYLTVDAPAAELDYDLAVSATPGVQPALADTGVPAERAAADVAEPPVVPDTGNGVPVWPVVAGVGAALAVVAVGVARPWARTPR
jgi:hypothetical protein